MIKGYLHCYGNKADIGMRIPGDRSDTHVS